MKRLALAMTGAALALTRQLLGWAYSRVDDALDGLIHRQAALTNDHDPSTCTYCLPQTNGRQHATFRR